MSKNLIDTAAQTCPQTPVAILSPKYNLNCCQGNTPRALYQNSPKNRGAE